MNKCRRCLDYKVPEMFRVRSDTGKLRQVCRACENIANLKRYHGDPQNKTDNRDRSWKHNLKKNYGITPEIYHQMVEAQGGECGICREKEADTRFGKFCVDHCHETGTIRGLLCITCNYAIGCFSDDPKIILRAIDYLAAETSCA